MAFKCPEEDQEDEKEGIQQYLIKLHFPLLNRPFLPLAAPIPVHLLSVSEAEPFRPDQTHLKPVVRPSVVPALFAHFSSTAYYNSFAPHKLTPTLQ